MNLKSFYWKPTFIVELSGADLNMLQLCSKHHYDGTCQDAAKQRGVIFAMMNGHNLKRAGFDNRPDPTNPTPFVTAVSEHHLTFSQIDLLAKIAEVEGFVTQLHEREVLGLNFTLVQMMKKANRQSELKNADEEDGE